MIVIDEMRLSDAGELAELDKKCFKIPWHEQSFVNEFNNEIAIYFIARENGIIGYAGFWNVSGEGCITNVAVLEEYRRRHIGSSLMEAMIKKAEELKLSLLTLEVRKSNIAAQNLYEKYGFEIIGERKNYYSDNREDALIMTRNF